MPDDLDSTTVPAGMIEELEALESEPVEIGSKGIPASFAGRLRDIRDAGWLVLGGDVPLPVLVLREAALEHNLRAGQEFCSRNGAWLAPHGKTTMAPQLFGRQLAAGAWAITVANVPQLQVCRRFRIPRVLVANEILDVYDLRYIAQQLRSDPQLDLYLLADSAEGVNRLGSALVEAGTTRRVSVLVEIGLHGGRAGVRTPEQAISVAQAILKQPALRFSGVEGFEGAVHAASKSEQTASVDSFLERMQATAKRLRPLHDPAEGAFIFSAGGTLFADRVIKVSRSEALDSAQLVLRMGCYIAHDSNFYDRHSAFGAASIRRDDEPLLQPALELWSGVLSRPEPTLCILSMGKRDAPTDVALPTPLYLSAGGSLPSALEGEHEVIDINDQHTFLRVPESSAINVGDLIGCGISHPCAAFDRWRYIMLVDDDRRVTGAIKTFF
jgi:D-serine deaminase-like pyridoxal phosphate-dependent protein